MENMKDGTMPEAQEMAEERHPLENMQQELHQKGAILTKAWSDLFSFLTKYQGELMVKENSMEIAEREIEVRKRQLQDLKPDVASGTEEISKLQDEIHAKERMLSKSQSELTMKERLLQHVQSDLTSNIGLLDSARSELLEKRGELMRHRGDYERLKSELTLKEEQLIIKDNLLKKLQNQLMQENAELKEQLGMERRAHQRQIQSLQMERKAHEATKRTLLENMNSSSQSAIEIPDSPPTLDLTVEHADFGLSKIISSSRSPPHSESQSRLKHIPTDNLPMTTSSFPHETSPWPSGHQAQSATKFSGALNMLKRKSSASDQVRTPVSGIATTSTSDVFFPLSVSPNDIKPDIDNLMDDTEMTEPVPFSGPIPSHASGSDCDFNQMSTKFSSAGMSPGSGLEGGGNEKLDAIFHDAKIHKIETGDRRLHYQCATCQSGFTNKLALEAHVRGHRLHKCHICGKGFTMKHHVVSHLRVHTGEKPFSCEYCGRRFSILGSMKRHCNIVHRTLKL